MSEKAVLYLFTNPGCPHCPPARKMIEELQSERDDFIVKDMVGGTPEAAENAKKFHVMAVPTFIIQGPHYPENIGLSGSQMKASINKYLDLALGIKKEKKQSMFSKLKKLIFSE